MYSHWVMVPDGCLFTFSFFFRFCAFVTYDCAESAARAKKNLDREIIGDQYVVIHYRQV